MNRHVPSTSPDSGHHYAVRVYYEDTDAGGVVYHATYLRFAERARTEALREAGIPHAQLLAQYGLMFVVRRIEVDYVRPARVDDSLLVVTRPLAIGGATVTLQQEVRGPEGSCALLKLRLACVRPGEGKPARLPPLWRRVLSDMCAAAQDRG
jgi:acyl-CoA thioester hydrolase